MRTVLVRVLGLAGLGAALVAGCGADHGASSGAARVVVTTNILGDVVGALVGDAADVEVIMPPGASPHELAPSARQVASMREADLLVVNGLGFEAGLVDTIDAAAGDGVPVVAATDGVDVLPLADGDADDPHFFTDPVRMQQAVVHLAAALEEHVDGLAGDAFDARVEAYLTDLDDLDQEVEALVSTIPPARRVLVTNHEVFAYFADRYGFELLGAIIPGGSTLAEPSAADLADLASQIEAAGVPAIFAETSAPARLADALAREGTRIEVVELYSESLGEQGSDGATYLEMVRTNAERIAAALR